VVGGQCGEGWGSGVAVLVVRDRRIPGLAR